MKTLISLATLQNTAICFVAHGIMVGRGDYVMLLVLHFYHTLSVHLTSRLCRLYIHSLKGCTVHLLEHRIYWENI